MITQLLEYAWHNINEFPTGTSIAGYALIDQSTPLNYRECLILGTNLTSEWLMYTKNERFGTLKFFVFLLRTVFKPFDSSRQVINPDSSTWAFHTIKNHIAAEDIKIGTKIYLSEIPFFIDALLGRSGKNNYIWYTHPKSLLLKSMLYRIFRKKINGVIFQNSGYQELFLNKISIPSLVLWGGVENEYLERKIDVNSGSFVLIVSRFYKRKNPNTVDHIISQNMETKFVIAGSGWEEIASRHANVQIAEYTDSLIDLYDNASALVLTGDIEGGPLPLLEGATRGLPIYTRKTGIAGTKEWSYSNTIYYSNEQELLKLLARPVPSKTLNIPASILSWKTFGEKFRGFINEN